MPEQEFDLYLSLLVKLLRLSPEQKRSIEAELRDHFDERFEALVRSGVPRDQAIRRTLDEFGDVAGLAHEFTHLARKHIRRRIMQGTLATAGVAAAVVIWATLFRGPEPHAIGPAPNLVAQEDVRAQADEAAASANQPTTADALVKSIAYGPDVEWIDPTQFVPEKLRQSIDLEFTGTALRDVIAYVGELTGTALLFDRAALSEAGIATDEEVSLNIRGIPAHTALDVLLENVNQVELAWVEDHEVIRITTRDKADSMQITRHYNVRDLLNTGYSHQQLLDVVMNMTEGPWESMDGSGGTIADFGDLLVAKQCQRTQVDIAATLAGLRSQAPIRRIVELPSHGRLYAALDSQTDIEFTGTPLRDVISYISEMHNIPVVLDVPALSEAGLSGEEEVTIAVNGIRLRSALELLLEDVNQVELAPVIRDGLLWITTRDVANNTLQTVLYDVADITNGDRLLMEKLEEVVNTQTSGPWESLDGVGGVLMAATPKLLAARQTLPMQAEVRDVLAAVRASIESAGGNRDFLLVDSTSLETRFYRMDAEAADDVARLIPELIEPGTWKWIPLPGGNALPEAAFGTIHRLNAGRMLLRLDDGTVIDVPDQQPQPSDPAAAPGAGGQRPAGQPATAADRNVVVIPQSVLIITHKPSVLRQVSKLLERLLTDQGWASGTRGDKVKFISPGYQEGDWKEPLGRPGAPPAAMGGGMGAAGFGVGPVGGAVGGGGFGGGGFGAGGFGGRTSN